MWSKKVFQAGLAGILLAASAGSPAGTVLTNPNFDPNGNDFDWTGTGFFGAETNGGWAVGWDSLADSPAGFPNAAPIDWVPGDALWQKEFFIPGSDPGDGSSFLTAIQANPSNPNGNRFAIFEVLVNAGDEDWTDWQMQLNHPDFEWIELTFVVTAAGGLEFDTPSIFKLPTTATIAAGTITQTINPADTVDLLFGSSPVAPGDIVGITAVMEYIGTTDLNVDPVNGLTIGVDQRVNIVPVPAALPLLATALLGLGAISRRRRT